MTTQTGSFKQARNIILVAPSSPFAPSAFNAGLARLRAFMPNVAIQCMFGDAARQHGATDELPVDCMGHLADDDLSRAGYLNAALTKGGLVLMARGGFGVSRVLGLLDWAKITAAQPCVVGFSDFTALLNPLARAGVMAIHGPGLTHLPHIDDNSMQELAQLIEGHITWPRLLPGQQVVGGRAAGILVGGNLSMICHLIGTSYAPDFNQAILFLEEVNEPVYRLDRLLTKLELAGVAQKVAGVAMGDLHGWHEKLDEEERQLRRQLALKRISAWGKPFVCNLPFGHAACNRLLPVGGAAAIENGVLQVGLACGRKL